MVPELVQLNYVKNLTVAVVLKFIFILCTIVVFFPTCNSHVKRDDDESASMYKIESTKEFPFYIHDVKNNTVINFGSIRLTETSNK